MTRSWANDDGVSPRGAASLLADRPHPVRFVRGWRRARARYSVSSDKQGVQPEMGGSTRDVNSLEVSFFRAINSVVEPLARAGVGSPGLIPTGLVVLETSGRKSGLPRRVPLVAMLSAGHVVVGTVRVRNSQWLRNVLHTPDVRYWLGGQPYHARAVVVMPGADLPDMDEPSARCIAAALGAPATAVGAAFVILVTSDDRGTARQWAGSENEREL